MKAAQGDYFHLQIISELIEEVYRFKAIATDAALLEKALNMNLALIGESVNKISKELLEKYPEIPWRDIVTTRNYIIHDYFGLDTHIIHEVLDMHLGTLKETVSKMLADYKRS